VSFALAPDGDRLLRDRGGEHDAQDDIEREAEAVGAPRHPAAVAGTAYAALKHSFEKVDDRWVPKDEKGPSDPRSKRSTAEKRRGVGETYGGVDAEGNTKQELYERARKLGVEGRSKMSKRELARAIGKKQ
jgi:hypothetical protein